MRFFLIAVAVIAHAAHAQTVYKCADEKGRPVYTQQPCAEDAEVVDTSAALKTATGGSNLQGLSDYAAIKRLEFECKQRASAISSGFAARRAGVANEIAQAKYQMRFSNNNAAGASRTAGLQSKVGSLNIALQEINSDERQALAEHRKECQEQQKAERERQAVRDAEAAAAADDGG